MNAAFADYLKVAPGVNTVGWLAVLGFLLKAWFQNRRIGLESRKLTLDDNKGLRTEFIEEMHALRAEVKGLREENESLRREVRELHGIIDGMRRDSITGSISAQRAVIDHLPPETVTEPLKRALDSLDRVQGTGE